MEEEQIDWFRAAVGDGDVVIELWMELDQAHYFAAAAAVVG